MTIYNIKINDNGATSTNVVLGIIYMLLIQLNWYYYIYTHYWLNVWNN